MKAHTATRDVDDDNNNDNLYNMKKKLGVLDIDVNIKNNHNDEHGDDDDDVYQEFYQTVTQSTFPYVFICEVCQLQQTYLRNNRSSNEKSLKGFPNYNYSIIMTASGTLSIHHLFRKLPLFTGEGGRRLSALPYCDCVLKLELVCYQS